MLQEGGPDLPTQEFTLTSEAFFERSEASFAGQRGLEWAGAGRQWCLFGGLPEAGRTLSIVNLVAPAPGAYHLLARTLTYNGRLQVQLTDTSGQALAKSTAGVDNPTLVHYVASPTALGVEVRPGQTPETSFTLVGLQILVVHSN